MWKLKVDVGALSRIGFQIMVGRSRLCGIAIAFCGAAGCIPSPIAPGIRGSVGVTHEGFVTNAVKLPRKGEGYSVFCSRGFQWGHPRLVAAIQDAARAVVRARPDGAPLLVCDLGARFGGEIPGHRSHQSGRDVDLLLYVNTPDGRPAEAGFVKFGADGLAQTEGGDFVRLDVDRQWLFIRALVSSPSANVQWMFLARWLEALLIEHARARGEDPELVWHAESVLMQPWDSAAHDDHMHLRIACMPDEAVAGCIGGGPYWPWLPALPQLASPPDSEMIAAIAADLLKPRAMPARVGAP